MSPNKESLYSDLSVFWLVLSEEVVVIVHEAKSSGFSSSVLSVEPEQNEIFFVAFLGFGQELREVLLGNVGELWVIDIDDLRSTLNSVLNQLKRKAKIKKPFGDG